MENRQFEAMLAVAQERLAQHIPEDIAEKAGARYADGSLSLKTLGQTVTVRRDLGILPPEELERRCRSLGAEILPSNADFCARFDFAPRYPVWMKVWFADEEFPASGRLLLDESAPHYLTVEDAVTVGSLILDQLTGAQHWAV